MNRYIKEPLRNRHQEFDDELLKPLIQHSIKVYFDYMKNQNECPEYDSAVDFVTQYVQSYLEDLIYRGIDKHVKSCLDNNFKQ